MPDQKLTDVQSADLKYDVRLHQHSLRRGRLAYDDVEAYLASLPDDADEAVECDVRFGAGQPAKPKKG